MFGILKKKDKIYKIKLERFNTQLCNYYNLKQNMHKSKEYEKLDSSFEEAFNSFLNRSMYELELEFDKSEYQNNLELYHSNVKENFKTGGNFDTEDIVKNLTFMFQVKINDPKFAGQTKNRLDNSELTPFSNYFFSK